MLQGRIGDYDVPLLLDSGGQISIIPAEVVPVASLLFYQMVEDW